MRNHLRESTLEEWAARKVRGELIRKYKKGALDLIDQVWRAPTTNKLTMLLDVMNQADRKTQGETTCGRCGQETVVDTTHRILTCPTVAEAWNDAERQMWKTITPTQDEAPIITTTTFRAQQHKTQYRLASLGAKRALNPGATPFYPTSAAVTKIALMMAHAEMDQITQSNIAESRKWAEHARQQAGLAKLAANEASDSVDKTTRASTEANHIRSMTTKHLGGNGGSVVYENDASQRTKADFITGHVIAIVGRELTGQGRGKHNENKEQELIHEATQVSEPGTQNKPPGKNRPLLHHVWWGVVNEDQDKEV